LLPERGFRRGALVEWLSAGEGVGAGTLALLAAKHACRDGGILAVFDNREFFPPAAVRLGIEREQLVVIRARTAADNHWAIDQALRSPAVAAVLAWPDRIDDRTFRRWQLSAEEGGCVAMLLRYEAAKNEPSWADVRLLVEPLPEGWIERSEPHQDSYNCRLLRITLLRCRGKNAGENIDVELDDETYRVRSLDRRRWRLAN
jgi:protein ImuA